MVLEQLTKQYEALALDCRNEGTRKELAVDAAFWLSVVETLRTNMKALQVNIVAQGAAKAATAVKDGADDAGEDDDGLSFSFHVEKSKANAISDGSELTPTDLKVADAAQATLHMNAATSAFRLLRNACAACQPSQDACRKTGLLRLAHQFVIQCCTWVDVPDEQLQSTVVLMCQIALQFLVNGVTGNLNNQAHVWELFFPDDFQKILVECHSHRKIVAFTGALVLNCINGDLADPDVTTRRTDLVCARNLVITLLQRCLTKPASSVSPLVELSADEDPAFEWICLVFRTLFQAGFARDLYNAVGAHMLSQLWSRVTPEQLILLRMFNMWMTAGRHRDIESGSALSSTPATQAHPSKTTPALLEFTKSTWVFVVSTDQEDRPDEADEARKAVWMVLEDEAKILLLEVLGELTLQPQLVRHENACNGLLGSLLSELQRVWAARRHHNATNAPSATPTTDGPAEPFGYRSAMIRVVGNLCYRHKKHQDLVREDGFLPLLLNLCNIDETNPMIREWALVALRNVCEGNEANQAYISALRPQGVDTANAQVDLERAGVDVQLDEHGKVHVSKRGQ
ncbi:TPA: hypothetical protein N0F65_008332 [Lagenidium giganteum]|uniref:Ataxin-10 domain-containing protein n=1 Tax=Lagenidium giganteum TaxID=4803 RepID=A0AAV2YUM6_9STRA|nr:TPA: hypothetical protein N0F65_008332 [Lagenidium giganteum]